jgi:two-component system chemotaxis response regulator CheY
MDHNSDISFMIVDINMPKINGLELCKRIKSAPQWKELNILIFSTEISDSYVDEARALGIAGWLLKPFNKEHVIKAINKIISKTALAIYTIDRLFCDISIRN